MRRLTHPDNDCTAGWTAFQALLDEGDATLLAQIEPRVTFTPTFYVAQYLNELHEAKGVERHLAKGNAGSLFYIHTPKDSALFTYLMIQLENQQ